MRTLDNFQELGDVLEPFDPNYLSNRAYEVPKLSSYEERFIHKVSIVEKKLRRNNVRFEWLSDWRCFRLKKFLNPDYPIYMYIRINMDEGDYSFGTAEEDLVWDGHISVVLEAVLEWLGSNRATIKEEPATRVKWRVLPVGYHLGYCPTVCNTRKEAEEQAAYLTETTGFRWTVVKK